MSTPKASVQRYRPRCPSSRGGGSDARRCVRTMRGCLRTRRPNRLPWRREGSRCAAPPVRPSLRTCRSASLTRPSLHQSRQTSPLPIGPPARSAPACACRRKRGPRRRRGAPRRRRPLHRLPRLQERRICLGRCLKRCPFAKSHLLLRFVTWRKEWCPSWSKCLQTLSVTHLLPTRLS